MLFQLALRNVLRQARRNAMLGIAIAIGVASLLLFSAIMRGMTANMADLAVDNLAGHIKIMDQEFLQDPSITRAIEQPANLEDNTPPGTNIAGRIVIPAVIMSERETRGIVLIGAEPATEWQTSFLRDADLAGKPLTGTDDSGVLIGARLADQLNVRINRRLVLIVERADGTSTEFGARIRGVYTSTDGQDSAQVYTGLQALQNRLATNGVTEVAITLSKDADGATPLQSTTVDLAEYYPQLEVKDWRALLPMIALMIEWSDSSVAIMASIFLIALAFGVLNTLITAVLERIRELGLLHALGMRKGLLVREVLIESMIVVLAGLAAGIVLGLGAIWLLADGIDLSQFAAGTAEFGISNELVPVFAWPDLVQVSVMVTLLGLLGAAWPAWLAIRLDPLDALKADD